jgi:hypothetical protein
MRRIVMLATLLVLTANATIHTCAKPPSTNSSVPVT